jgi:hypothetical protein
MVYPGQPSLGLSPDPVGHDCRLAPEVFGCEKLYGGWHGIATCRGIDPIPGQRAQRRRKGINSHEVAETIEEFSRFGTDFLMETDKQALPRIMLEPP